MKRQFEKEGFRDVRIAPSEVEKALRLLLLALKVDLEDENYRETPERIEKWLTSHFISVHDFADAIDEIKSKTFPSEYRGVVTQTGIRVYGLCPHHFLPVEYDVSIGYLAHKKMIGLSKLSRIAELCLHPAVLQETGTERVATTLQTVLEVQDVAVVVSGRHNCMVVRGVEQDASLTTTSEMRGLFQKDEGGIKSEFLQLVHSRKANSS